MREHFGKRLVINQIKEIVERRNVKKIRIICGRTEASVLEGNNDDRVLTLYMNSIKRAHETQIEIRNNVPQNVVVELTKFRTRRPKVTINVTKMEGGNGSNKNNGRILCNESGLSIELGNGTESGKGTNTGNGIIGGQTTTVAHRRRTGNGKVKKRKC